MIPGLEQAEFVRYGVMHRNSFMNSPELLQQTYQSRKRDDLFFAGQMTGVEGYVESAASGLVAGINAAKLAKGKNQSSFRRNNNRQHGVLHYACRRQTFPTNECQFWLAS